MRRANQFRRNGACPELQRVNVDVASETPVRGGCGSDERRLTKQWLQKDPTPALEHLNPKSSDREPPTIPIPPIFCPSCSLYPCHFPHQISQPMALG